MNTYKVWSELSVEWIQWLFRSVWKCHQYMEAPQIKDVACAEESFDFWVLLLLRSAGTCLMTMSLSVTVCLMTMMLWSLNKYYTDDQLEQFLLFGRQLFFQQTIHDELKLKLNTSPRPCSIDQTSWALCPWWLPGWDMVSVFGSTREFPEVVLMKFLYIINPSVNWSFCFVVCVVHPSVFPGRVIPPLLWVSSFCSLLNGFLGGVFPYPNQGSEDRWCYIAVQIVKLQKYVLWWDDMYIGSAYWCLLFIEIYCDHQ